MEVSVVTSVELTTMFDIPQRDVSGRLVGVMAEESADTLIELLSRFAICRCGIPGRQRWCVVEVSVVTQLELTAMFGIPRRGMSGRTALGLWIRLTPTLTLTLILVSHIKKCLRRLLHGVALGL